MGGRFEEIGRELVAMMAADQRARAATTAGRTAVRPAGCLLLPRSLLLRAPHPIIEVDQRNTARLREIVDEIGWPGVSAVGDQAAEAAWLIAQHADLDRAFQRRCLELMRTLAPGEVLPRHIASLEDRVLVGEGKPQRYGTQLRRTPDGRLEPAPIADPDGVDARRAAVGLERLAEYLARSAERLG
jgi:hypothetical protein